MTDKPKLLSDGFIALRELDGSGWSIRDMSTIKEIYESTTGEAVLVFHDNITRKSPHSVQDFIDILDPGPFQE